jgi:RNA-dependent RNA polymerase
MLLLKDEEDTGYDTTKPRVYLRPSQIKIEFDETELRKRHVPIVDIIRFSRHKMSANLSPDTLVNLAENGVPHAAFCKLMVDGLQASVEALTEYKDKTSMLLLWRAVQKVGNVISQRISRELGGASRARGFGDRQEDEQEDDDEDAEEEDEKGYLGKSSAWWVDMISGCPSSLEETVMTMLDSGFNPNKK